jgi:surface antigen
LTDSETPDPLAFLFGGMTDETPASTASTASDGPSAPAATDAPAAPVITPAAPVAPAEPPVYRTRREMRAAGGYLQEAAAPTPAAAPDVVAPVTASVPLILPAVAAEPAVPSVPVTPADAAPGVDAFAAMFGQTAPVHDAAASAAPVEPEPAAPDLAMTGVEAPTSRRALRAARTSFAASESVRAPRTPRAPRGRAAKAERAPRDPAASQQRKKLRERITAAGVMVLVGGLFAALALPAYADSGSGGVALVAAHSHGSQALGVDASLDKAGTARDDYGATSAEDLAALYASAVRQKNLSAFLASGSAAQGNDYPWPSELSRNQGGGLSPLNYYYRECVDFVAWRLSRDAGSSPGGPYRWNWSALTPNGGNASQWLSAWQDHGWPTGSTPQVGSVAWFPGGNHVAYVSGILSTGMIVIDEYNWGGAHEYDQRVIDPSTVTFLYAPPK